MRSHYVGLRCPVLSCRFQTQRLSPGGSCPRCGTRLVTVRCRGSKSPGAPPLLLRAIAKVWRQEAYLSSALRRPFDRADVLGVLDRPEREAYEDFLAEGLEEAVVRLVERYGPTWGAA